MYNPFIGILKFILSILVVAIHVQPFSGNLAFYLNNCIARLAVPIFFTLSSYFLFDKLLENNWDKKIFWKQQKHLAKYYLVWVLLHLPFILSQLLQSTNSIPEFVWRFIQGIFLKGPYGALWFLPASLLGLTLVYILGKKVSPHICLAVSLPLFLFATLQIEYNAFVKDITWITDINQVLTGFFGWLANGLNVGFFFCSLGLYIAASKNKIHNRKYDILKAILSVLALLIETTIIRNCNLGVDYWAMFFIIPSTYYIVQIALNLKKTTHLQTISFAKHLQNLSLLIYPMHFAVMDLLRILFADVTIYMQNSSLQFVSVLIFTVSISILILYLGEKKHLRFAKLFYGK